MPNRIIRESALTSHSLASLSDGAERLFWRLTVVADDHGRFDAYPITVKAKCFPTRVDTLKTTKIIQWMVELSQDHCFFYTVEGRPYGQFHNWSKYQRQYGLESKFPQPPAACGEVPQDPALILIQNRESRIDIVNGSRQVAATPRTTNGVMLQKAKRSITDEDKPTEKHFSLGKSLNVDVGPEWGKFKNYCLAHDKRYANFEAAFRNWIANAASFKEKSHVVR